MTIVIGRPINGIPLNGLEYLMETGGEYKTFETKEEAVDFIRERGYAESTDDEIEDMFVFKTLEGVEGANSTK